MYLTFVTGGLVHPPPPTLCCSSGVSENGLSDTLAEASPLLSRTLQMSLQMSRSLGTTVSLPSRIPPGTSGSAQPESISLCSDWRVTEIRRSTCSPVNKPVCIEVWLCRRPGFEPERHTFRHQLLMAGCVCLSTTATTTSIIPTGMAGVPVTVTHESPKLSNR